MYGPSSDRNLLMGIVALQMDFISRDALIKAMHDWTLDKTRSLAEILVKNGALDPEERSVLEGLVERHIARHGGDAEKSLSSLEVGVPSRSTLESLEDPDVQQSLSKLGVSYARADEPTDPDRTDSWGDTNGDMGGRFRIINLHDEGGLGCVFLARDAEVNREVALKQMKEDIAADPQLRARFVFEAEITGNLEHPGIVPVYGMGAYSDGRPYYAMRFIRGDTLKVAVDRFHKDPAFTSDSGARRREFQKLLRRFLVVCETMSYAHSRGIIHRDLKPRNILLGPYGETLVVDWGLAKVVGHHDAADRFDATLRPPSGSDVQPTTAGSRVGTPGYMSPEQARGEVDQLSPSTDIYSLGATLYYMLTRRAPFNDQDLPEALCKIERGEFPPPRAVNYRVDRALEAICLKAMQLRPPDRYASSRKLADELELWLADQPVSAYPEPFATKVTRWVRRRKQLVTAAAVICVVGLGGLVTHDWRITTEKNRTIAQLAMTRTGLRDLLAVAGESVARFPGSGPLRSMLAMRVLGNYRSLLKDFPDDAEVRVEIVQVYDVVGGLARVTGQFTESQESYGNALELLDSLSRMPSHPTSVNELRIKILVNRGELFHMNGRLSMALADFDQASVELERHQSQVGPLAHRKHKASILINRSEVLALAGRTSEARTNADLAVRLLDPGEQPGKGIGLGPEFRLLLAMALTDRGTAAASLSEHRSAELDFRNALSLVQEFPASTEYEIDAKAQLAATQTQLGVLLADDHLRQTDALDSFGQSIGMFETLAKQFNHYTVFRKGLAEALGGRCDLLMSLRRWAEARKDSNSARIVVEGLLKLSPGNAEFASLSARVLSRDRRISLNAGDAKTARRLLVKCIEQLRQAVAIDPGRMIDRQMLDRMESDARAADPDGS